MTTVLQRVEALAPALAKRSEEVEQAGRLPADVLGDLVAAGVFRLIVPPQYGGEGAGLSEAMAAVEALSQADASVGWNAMIGISAALIVGFLPLSTVEAVYQDGPDVVVAGVLAPKGRAVKVDGGYRVTGQWPFASGCHNAAWIALHAVVEGGEPLPNGMPQARVAFLPVDQVEILDTWHVSGLKGTGSNDVRVDDVFCPDDRTCTLFGAAPTIESPIFAISPVAQLGLYVAAVAVGIAAGATAEVAELAAGGKKPAFGARRLADSPLFQERLGEADGLVRAARAALRAEAAGAWDKAVAGTPLTILDRARLRAAGGQVARMATAAVDTAYHAGGGTSLYETSPLQRRLRDIHAVTQHAAVGADFTALVGAVLAGADVDTMRL